MEISEIRHEDGNEETWFDDATATFGDRLTAGREALGLSAAALAEKLGVAQETLLAWEQDKSGPRANRLQMLASILNVSLKWLVTGEGIGPLEDDSLRVEDARAILSELRALRNDADKTAQRLVELEAKLAAAMEKVA